jgi:hypothetical protein
VRSRPDDVYKLVNVLGIYVARSTQNISRLSWCNGNIDACHASAPSSILGERAFLFDVFNSVLWRQTVARQTE